VCSPEFSGHLSIPCIFHAAVPVLGFLLPHPGKMKDLIAGNEYKILKSCYGSRCFAVFDFGN